MAESNSEDIEKYVLAKEMRMTSFESNMRIGTVEYQRRGQCDFRASSTTVAAMAKKKNTTENDQNHKYTFIFG